MAEHEGPPTLWPDLVRLRIDLAYDGGPFRGFAANEGVPTVAGALTVALERVLGPVANLVGAGRTDAGVHARHQVVSVDVSRQKLRIDRLGGALNRLLNPTIAVRAVEVAAPTFNARFDATHRTYRYRVLAAPVLDPLRAATTWHVREPLDLAALRQASIALLGTHDFGAFCRRPPVRPDGAAPSLVREVQAARWLGPDDDVLVFEIRARAFCHQMVRSIVGTVVDAGRGRRTAADVAAALVAGDRRRAGPLAPAHGLVLWEVGYGAPEAPAGGREVAVGTAPP